MGFISCLKGFWWAANRLHQFLHPAINSDASSSAQKPEGCLFLLQCPYRDAAHRPDERRSHPSQTGTVTSKHALRSLRELHSNNNTNESYGLSLFVYLIDVIMCIMKGLDKVLEVAEFVQI